MYKFSSQWSGFGDRGKTGFDDRPPAHDARRLTPDSGFLLNQVSHHYLIGGQPHPIFQNLDLQISSQALTVVLGRSGCGKTTLLRLLAGLIRPTAGSIRFLKAGKVIEPKIGVVFQESRLFPWLSVAENITIHRKKGPEAAALQKKYLAMMGLTEFAAVYPFQLSGGMAQKIAIARALAYEPDILLMDEPFSALDYFTRQELQEEILKIFRELSIGIVFVTHNVEEALSLATDLLILKKAAAPIRFALANTDQENKEIQAALLKKQILELLKE